MRKASGQYFLHTGIIIRTLHRFNTEFTIVTFFRLAFLINNHRSYRLKTADVRDIKCLHTIKIFHTEPVLYFMHGADRTAFFSPYSFTVFLKYHAGIFPCKLYKLFFCAFFRYYDVNLLLSSGSQPFFDYLCIFDFRLQCDFSRDKRSTCIKLFYKTGQYL